MKRALIVAGLLVIVAAILSYLSCAGLPEPAGEGDSLVIGSLILDFPEGLYDNTRQKLDINVQVTFRNITRNQRFHVYTKRGYFYFLTNGNDEYILEGFRILKTEIDETLHSFSEQVVDLKIANSTNSVVYLGHVTVTYSAPHPSGRRGMGGRVRYYRYESSATVDWDHDLLLRYMADQQPEGPWLDLEIVECGRNSRAQWQQESPMERRARQSFLPLM